MTSISDVQPAQSSQPHSQQTHQQQDQTDNGGQSQRELEATLASTATAAPDGPLLNFQNDLHRDLPVPLHRQDTETQTVDEFVDAQG